MITKKATFELYLRYNRTGRLGKGGLSPVYLRIYINKVGERSYNTKVRVAPHEWDEKRRRVKNVHPLAAQYNEHIYACIKEIEDFQMELLLHKEPVTLERLLGFRKKEEFTLLSFTEFFERQLQESSKASFEKNTTKTHKSVLTRFKEFQPTVHFSELNYAFIQRYDLFLRNMGYSLNSAGKHHRVLKRYIHQAIHFGHLEANQNPYARFKIKEEPTMTVFLTTGELKQLEQLRFKKADQELEVIRDFFLFCCYTGLRYSDASRIHKGNLSDTDQGLILSFRAQKTKKQLEINLRDLFHPTGQVQSKPEKLVLKYLTLHRERYNGHKEFDTQPLFYGFTNQYINRELKKIAQLIECRQVIKDNLSCHTARHTFGTIIADKVDNLAYVQELMQHSKISVTRKYLHLSKKALSRALKAANWDD